MVHSGLLLSQVQPEKKAPYIMGSLFALGGLLKIEARNYLETKLKYDQTFRTTGPLIEESKSVEDSVQKNRRDLSAKDIAFFESKDGFLKVFVSFVKSLVGSDRNIVNLKNLEDFMRFTHEDFIDELEDARKADEATITAYERGHYTLLFLFDLLQFSFQFLVLATKESISASSLEEKPARTIFDPHSQMTLESDF